MCLCIFLTLNSAENVKKYVKEYGSQKAIVEVSISNNHIIVSESLQLKITIHVPKGLEIDFPDGNSLGFSYEFSNRSHRFRPTDISEIKKVENPDGSKVLTQIYTLEPWLSNDYAIPPILFSFYKVKEKEPSDEKGTNTPELLIISEGVRIKVDPVPLTDKKLSELLPQANLKNENLVQRIRRDEDKSQQEKLIEQKRNKDEKKLFENKKFPWKLIFILLGIFSLLWAIYTYLKKKGIDIFKRRKFPAHIIAMQRIEKLLQLNYLEQGLLKEFYYELSYILREYIGNRFMLYAVNQTSEEFLVSIAKNNPFDKDSEKDLFNFNDTADTAKYSRHTPAKEQANSSLEFAKSFINKTKIVEESEGK